MTTNYNLWGGLQVSDTKPLHVLRYPDAIPNLKSLKSQALWADRISAFWPDGYEPEPLTRGQEVSFTSLKELMESKQSEITFKPMRVGAESREAVEEFSRTYTRSRAASSEGLALADEETGLLDRSQSDVKNLTKVEARNFLYSSKLTFGMIDMLLKEGHIEPVGDPYLPDGFAASPDFVEGLLAAIAEDVAGREGNLTLVPSNVRATKSSTQGRETTQNHLALALKLPALPDVSNKTDLRDILELRSSRKFKSARADYLASLYTLQDQIQQALGDEPDPSELREDFLASVRQELDKTSSALWQIKDKVGFTMSAIGVSSVLVDFGQTVTNPDALSVISGGLTIAGGFVAFTVNSRKHPFLRMASRKGVGLVAPSR